MMIIKDKYYYPNNSLLIVCGDVKHDAAFKLVEDTFGDWKSSGFDPLVKFPIPPFKPLKKDTFFVKESTIAQAPFMQYTWHGPSYLTDSASTIAADVFSTIVGLNSSKLQQALVDKNLASSVSVNYQTCRYVGPTEIFVVPNPDKIKECHEELMKQVSMWDSADYYTDEQLNDAKSILQRNDLRSKEKPSSLASQLSYQWCSTSLNYGTDLNDNYQKVTRADIKKYLDAYIIGKPKVAGIIIKPELNKQLNVASFFVAK
jgi:zinc protease